MLRRSLTIEPSSTWAFKAFLKLIGVSSPSNLIVRSPRATWRWSSSMPIVENAALDVTVCRFIFVCNLGEVTIVRCHWSCHFHLHTRVRCCPPTVALLGKVNRYLSTETAIVLTGILAALVLLDLSDAFDAVDQCIILKLLILRSLGITDSAHW